MGKSKIKGILGTILVIFLILVKVFLLLSLFNGLGEFFAEAFLCVIGLASIATIILKIKDAANPERKRNRNTAAALAIILGTFGAHKFHCGRYNWGYIYIIFDWTGIPTVLGIIEGLVFICMDDEQFNNHVLNSSF